MTQENITIKVSGCNKCPFWEHNLMICTHPYNMYEGDREDEFIEYCPLKKGDTTIKFERE